MTNNILEDLIKRALKEAEDKGKKLDLSKEDKSVDEATVGVDDTKFNLRTGVNKNPTKLGIKIQFEPKAGALEGDLKGKLEVALQEKLNLALADYDIQVSKDTDVPREEVIGFFIPLSQLKNLIVTALTGKAGPKPGVMAPPPSSPPQQNIPQPPPPSTGDGDSAVDELDEMIREELYPLINEMKVRDLNELSKVVKKEDFYEFINKGNNILRSCEHAGMDNGKKYLIYLIKHNIM